MKLVLAIIILALSLVGGAIYYIHKPSPKPVVIQPIDNANAEELISVVNIVEDD